MRPYPYRQSSGSAASAVSTRVVCGDGLRLVANAYLTAFYTADLEAARPLLAENFSFHGRFAQPRGREPFLDSAAGLKDPPIFPAPRLLLYPLRPMSDVAA
jgi:hypothetical protein